MLNAYTITFAALLVPAGKLADRLGHKRVFLDRLGPVHDGFGRVRARADGRGARSRFRIVQAVGAAALIPSSLALVMRAYPRDRLPVAVAIWGAMGAAAGAVGPTIGSVLVEAASWRWVFLINVPAGLVTVGLGRRVLRESSDPTSRVPALAGVVAIAGAAALASLAVVQSDEWGWTDPRTLGAFAAAVVHLRLLRRPPAPDPGPGGRPVAVRHPQLRVGEPRHLRVRHRLHRHVLRLVPDADPALGLVGACRPGLAISPGPLLVAILAPRFGRLAGRIGQRPLLVAGGVAFALERPVATGGDGRRAELPDRTTCPPMLLSGSASRCASPSWRA